MSRRHAAGHTLPENPHWLNFTRSDGDPSNLPKNTKKIVTNGQVNYMREVDMDESLAIMWRVNVGKELATRMGLPAGPSYVLENFPYGYKLYDHNKGPVKAPRHDPYLYGSEHTSKFRSTNEFIPHALWLMQDETQNRANCQCKYCTKLPQRLISDSMGLSAVRRSASVAGPSQRQTRPRVPREPREPRQPRAPKPYAAVRRVPPPPPKAISGPEQFMLRDRDFDIRSAVKVSEVQRPRLFRKSEIVWCHLDPQIRGRTPEEDIHLWPGVVEYVHFRVIPRPTGPTDGEVDMKDLYQEAADNNPALGAPPGDPSAAGPSGTPPTAPLEAAGSVPWTIEHCYAYQVKLLGTTRTIHLTDAAVLPYLAHLPSHSVLERVNEEFLNYLETVNIEEMDRDLDEHMFDFDPMEQVDPEKSYEKFKRAAAPYTLAIQIASFLTHFWLPTDEWECKFVLPTSATPPASASTAPSMPPPPPPPPQNPPEPQVQTLHSIIQQSMNNNAGPAPTISGREGPADEPQSISMLGTFSHSITAPQTVTQKRFQGLWWGSEKIWVDELVRLKIARCQFAPKGTDVILPPAGPSPATVAHAQATTPGAEGVDPQRLGAQERGLFFRIEGLFVVDTPAEDGSSVTKECRASGMVYELVDADWEDPEAPKVDGAASVDKGKGKARESPSMDVDGTTSISQGLHGLSFTGQPSLPQPSPPNPDPSAPSAEGTSASAKPRKLNDQLSHPVLSSSYPLPPPPSGFKFRPILQPGHEVVISLSLISGRYYPELLFHPLMAPLVAETLQYMSATNDVDKFKHIFAMDGLVPGVFQSMEPQYWRGSRTIMLTEADSDARKAFRARWDEVKMARLHPQMQWEAGAEGQGAMEVD